MTLIKELLDWINIEILRVGDEKIILYKKGDKGYMKYNTELRILNSTKRKIKELTKKNLDYIKELDREDDNGSIDTIVLTEFIKDLEEIVSEKEVSSKGVVDDTSVVKKWLLPSEKAKKVIKE